MPAVNSLRELLVEELRDIYDAEKRLTKALPKISKASSHDELTSAIDAHLEETREHVTRLEQAFEAMDVPARAKTCAGMKGLIEEGDEHAGEDYADDGLRDAAIIGAAQRVEHYEIAAYGTAIAHAKLLELDDVVALLESTLEEEKAADSKLTEIAESVVNLEASASDETEEDDDTAEEPVRRPAMRMSMTGARSAARPKNGGKARAR
ncbi:MAG TPA: ferritin-like domain-containing protein [Vicinamibacterales bacterium]|nr:ferritin-like domain-containing protein [Vicinamibacterales bacterium]